MFRLTPLEALLVSHFIMDWIFQWNWMAMNKSKKWTPLFVHCLVYTLGFIPAFYFLGMNFLWLTVIFLSHVLLDQRKFELWLMEKFKRCKKEEMPESLWTVVLIGLDQVLHIAILAAIVLFS